MLQKHIYNRLTLVGKTKHVQAVRKALQSKNGLPIDFNKIIPVPPELLQTKEYYHALLYYKRDYEKVFLDMEEQKKLAALSSEELKEAESLAKQYDYNSKTYGYIHASRFRTIYWEVQHNALFSEIELSKKQDGSIHFMTLQNAPLILFTKLSTQFPLVTFILEFSDDTSFFQMQCYEMSDGERVWIT